MTHSHGNMCQGLPLHPLILLPDGRIYLKDGSDFNTLLNQCFCSALCHAIRTANPPRNPTCRPEPVSWLNLELNPRKKDDVTAVVLPILPDSHRRGCYVEIIPGLRPWAMNELSNLRCIVAVPWPDIDPLCLSLSNNRERQKKSGPKIATKNKCIDLSIYKARDIKVSILPDIFQETTGDLLITLLLSTIKGFVRDSARVLNGYLSPYDSEPEDDGDNALNRESDEIHLHLPRRPLSSKQLAGSGEGPAQERSNSTAPPTSLTLAQSFGGGKSRLRSSCRPHMSTRLSASWVQSQTVAVGVSKTLRETVVGFLGLSTGVAQKAASMISKGLGMRVVYHQKYRLSSMTYHFFAKKKDFLQESDVIIVADDFYAQRITTARDSSPPKLTLSQRSRLTVQDGDFKLFSPSAIFISTTPSQSFNYSAMAAAVRCQHLSGAAFIIPHDGSLHNNNLKEFDHLENVIIIPPASCPSCAPQHLRYRLALMTLEHLSRGIGCHLQGTFSGAFSPSKEESHTKRSSNSQQRNVHNSYATTSEALLMQGGRWVSYLQDKGLVCRNWLRAHLDRLSIVDNAVTCGNIYNENIDDGDNARKMQHKMVPSTMSQSANSSKKRQIGRLRQKPVSGAVKHKQVDPALKVTSMVEVK